VRAVALWLSRLVLFAAAMLLISIGLKFITNPVGAAAASGIALTSPLAHTNMRASFGAFPLAGGLLALFCLLSSRRHLIGLSVTAATIGTALAVRIFGVIADDTLGPSTVVLVAESVLLAFCGAAIVARKVTADVSAGELLQSNSRS
jgi:hypothetical protein